MKLDELSPEERLIAEQAVMNFRSLNKACDAAADGTVLAVAEQLAMEQGRELIRRTLEVCGHYLWRERWEGYIVWMNPFCFFPAWR